jgi:hypothetical protein
VRYLAVGLLLVAAHAVAVYIEQPFSLAESLTLYYLMLINYKSNDT